MSQEILIANNYVQVPVNEVKKYSNMTAINSNTAQIATVVSNMAYYGYIPSLDVVEALNSLSNNELIKFWNEAEPAFEKITGANRNMDEFVVYKNFPQEVLDMSEAEYWMNQIFMYWGVPSSIFAQEVKERPSLSENVSLKVLSLAQDNTLNVIFENLCKNKSRWSDNQSIYAKELVKTLNVDSIDINEFSFKENGITAMAEVFLNIKNSEIKISNATDVLRFAAALSDGDISLRENVKFRKFKRSERRLLLSLLDNSNNLIEDMGLRKGAFKKFLKCLHPGDYNFENVKNAYHLLYNDDIKTFNSEVETKLLNKDISVLNLLKTRPGDFVRRFHKMYETFNNASVVALIDILPRLETIQLLKLDKYLLTIGNRANLIVPPKGNWTKAQILENKKVKLLSEDLSNLHKNIGQELSERLNEIFPDGVSLDLRTDKIKLQTNDQKLAEYGRGTEFDIPESMNYLRTASYWACKGHGSIWFDNGWNFFNEDWKSMGVCCWSSNHGVSGAVFSGDPTNIHELKGRACQMIDLNLNELEQQGIRYAVWNILAYSGIKFSDAEDVLATLQWGKDAQEGSLFEPSRAQMVFPLNGDSLTKYIAYIDVKERKLIYMDANLYADIHSADSNKETLSSSMPSYLEYLDSLPSVADLFIHAKEGSTPILYSDKDVSLEKGTKAYVFKSENINNIYEKIALPAILEKSGEEPIESKKMKI